MIKKEFSDYCYCYNCGYYKVEEMECEINSRINRIGIFDNCANFKEKSDLTKKEIEKIIRIKKSTKKEEEPTIYNLQEVLEKGIKKPEWRIQDIIPERGITIIGGPTCTYKTFLAIDIGLSTATGNDFLGMFQTKQCTVLYIDEENGDVTLPNRFGMVKKGCNYTEEFQNVYLSIFNNVKLDTEKGKELLLNIISLVKPKLVIIDSLVRCMIGDENMATDVRKIFENIKAVFEENPELSFVILHHTNKLGTKFRSLRGSGDFAAFADVVLMLSTHYNNYVNVKVEKNRHVDMSQFSDFAVRINGSEDAISFDYVESKVASTDVVSRAFEDYNEWIDDNDIRVWKTGDMENALKSRGHSRNAANDLKKRLLDDGHIVKLSHGKYEVKMIKVTDEEIQDE